MSATQLFLSPPFDAFPRCWLRGFLCRFADDSVALRSQGRPTRKPRRPGPTPSAEGRSKGSLAKTELGQGGASAVPGAGGAGIDRLRKTCMCAARQRAVPPRRAFRLLPGLCVVTEQHVVWTLPCRLHHVVSHGRGRGRMDLVTTWSTDSRGSRDVARRANSLHNLGL